MKKSYNPWILGALAVAAVLLLSSTVFVTSGSPTGKTGRDVVMMRCSTTDTAFSTSGYTGSSGTPSRRSAGCSENISYLLKDGFAIQDIGHYETEKTGYVVITLVR